MSRSHCAALNEIFPLKVLSVFYIFVLAEECTYGQVLRPIFIDLDIS